MNATALFFNQSPAQSVFDHRTPVTRPALSDDNRMGSHQERYFFGPEDSYEIQVASSIGDRIDAWKLVYDEYLKKGYADPDSNGLWYGAFDALPSTTTFLTRKNGRPVGALTIVFDGPMGLPADALYSHELNAMRNEGRRPCEIISLAHGEKSQSLLVLKHMFKLAYITARHLEKATDFVVTCCPGHGAFYERQLIFRQIGQEHAYGKVNGSISILMRLDLTSAREAYKTRFHRENKPRNMYLFFTSQIRHLAAWLRSCRHPLDPASLREYFIENDRFSEGKYLQDFVRILSSDIFSICPELGTLECVNL